MISNGVRMARLERLHNLLVTDAENETGLRFDLRAWISKHILGEKVTNLPKAAVETVGFDCGTYACTLGLAALDPEFQKEGLSIRNVYPDAEIGKLYPCYITPDGLEFWESRAGEEFFGLQYDEGRRLFDPMTFRMDTRTGKNAELEVASRVKTIMIKYSKVPTE